MATTIKRNLVLKELDIKEDPTTGKQRVFSITFDKKNGERVYYPRAVSCGLNMDLKANRCRGILAVDKNGKVTVKKAGKVTITVKAAATSQYQAAGKTITITVTKKAVKKAAK